jgi:molecular chaperone GrpE (heat shock protein)
MSIDRDTVIQTVAKEHGILISKDDPILAFLAVHDVCIDAYAHKMSSAISTVNEKLESVTDQHHRDSRKLAEKIISNYVNSIRTENEELKSSIKRIISETQISHEAIIDKLMKRAEESNNKAYFAMYASIAFSIISIISAIIIILI